MGSKDKLLLIRKILLRVTALLLVMVVVSFVYLSTMGFPDWLVEKVVDKIGSGDFALETSAIKLKSFGDVVFSDVHLYRKRVVGPAVIDADKLVVSIGLIQVLKGATALEKIKIIDGVVRPEMASGPEAVEAEGPIEPLELEIQMIDSFLVRTFFKDAVCSLQIHGNSLLIKDIHATVSDGEKQGRFSANAEYKFDSEVLDVHIETKLDPQLLIPLCETYDMVFTVDLINRFKYLDEVPRIEVDFTKKFGEKESLDVKSTVWVRNFLYQGVDVYRAEANVNIHFSDDIAIVKLDPLLVVRKEGLANTSITVDLNKGVVFFDGESALNPKALLGLIGVFSEESLSDYRFEGPVTIVSSGRVLYNDMKLTDVTAVVSGAKMGMDKYMAEECSFKLRVLGDVYSVSEIRGRVYGGDVVGEVEIVAPDSPESNVTYAVDIEIRNASFGEFARIVSKDKQADYQGQFTGKLKASGYIGDGAAEKMTGTGYIRIKEGRIFLLPIFGGLSTLLAKIVPGLEVVLQQNDMKSDFVIKGGKLHTDEILIEGDIISLKGAGYYSFGHDLKFDVQIRLLKAHTLLGKILKPIFYPVSKLFEFRLRGNLDDPHWSVFNFPVDMLEKLGLKKKKD